MTFETKLTTAQALSMTRRFGFKPQKGFRELTPTVWPGGKLTPSIYASNNTIPAEANKKVLIPLPL